MQRLYLEADVGGCKARRVGLKTFLGLGRTTFCAKNREEKSKTEICALTSNSEKVNESSLTVLEMLDSKEVVVEDTS